MSKKQEQSKRAQIAKQNNYKLVISKPNANKLEYDGIIIDNLGNTNFRVELDINGLEVTGTISGKMRMNYIKIAVGDHVRVEMSPYDMSKCRIVKRL